VCFFRFNILSAFCVSLDHFFVLLAFVVLGLVSSVSSQEIGRESEMTYYPILCQVGHETLTQ